MNEKLLVDAMVEANCDDYIKAIRYGNAKLYRETKNWFYSDQFAELTNYNPDEIRINCLEKALARESDSPFYKTATQRSKERHKKKFEEELF